MTRKEAERQTRQLDTLRSLGFTREEAEQLRRISMTLHRWHELECGTDQGCIERSGDDGEGAPYWQNAHSGKSYRIPDREKGAHKRLGRILFGKCLTAYIQTDPRGAALYIIRPGDVPEGQDVNGYYSRGVCVY